MVGNRWRMVGGPVLGTAALAAAPRAGLRKPLADLRQPREQIQAALGTLFGAC